MNSSVAFLLVFLSVLCATSALEYFIDGMEVENEEFQAFKTIFNKTYSNALDEWVRKKVFRENRMFIARHNYKFAHGEKTYNLRINRFSDMFRDEFSRTMNRLNITSPRPMNGSTYIRLSNVQIPDSVDWRQAGAVTPVKDQGHCGSCWAFSATGSLEGQHFRKAGKLVSLSEQNLMDCSFDYGNRGCFGGLMDNAFRYVQDNGGINSEKEYPYIEDNEACHYDKSKIAATESGHVDIPIGDEEALKEAVATVGPISVGIDAGQSSFMMYSGGVYEDEYCSTTKLNHGVLVVGYGTTSDGLDYWIVKNSWSAHWGEGGYVRIARNAGNMCGIASYASYPLV